ncbi:Zn(II)2Cys6 transcription factor [Aspergillus ibericus CBS 121593]|uniref:Zn(2)-C6 fungal-type domain-containing protein n=1 Tax=Aspergillus ibericus CBS 121593 TaxID=1448316 RepID=A0A395GP52_9EURO|nr:hypothetical protein BO80DRAFT_414899 [Aspergillus ibericus CBS 121593]RAK97290.1 hypothetical protein BO80DRAFT_414899 [Aspergillus ibericus CBS 121593]
MATDTTSSGIQVSGYRIRRAHEKSRNGCLRCKQQRKKCDELRPSCSRCTRRSCPCRYQPRLSTSGSDTESSSPNSRTVPVVLSNDIPPSISQLSLSPQLTTEEDNPDLNSPSPDPLHATELSLLAHYLTHTSQTIPVDHLDLHALAVGVPNLAFKCKAVMSSLLSLAAACKCHDIAHEQTRNPLDSQKLTEIQELLALAERHHRASLRHIQATMQNSESYDNVLANAALMVLYASASHSIRVHLAATAKRYGQRLPTELLPQHSQWISFTRAAHTASTAVLNNIVEAATSEVVDPRLESRRTMPATGNAILSPQDGPSSKTKRLFLPLVASTYDRALRSLRKRAQCTAAQLLQGPQPHASASRSSADRRLHACLETVSILEKCTSAALLPRESRERKMPETPWNHQHMSILGCSRAVTPWVARYMISVTSMESPRVLRRIIMSFLNQAPTEFLNLVQSVLDCPAEGRTQGSAATGRLPLTAMHVLAMDIFAHWLVLVMLLDGVWWIRNIGEWELGQVISLMKTQNVLCQLGGVEMWWPERMYLAKQELVPITCSDRDC